MISFAIAYQFLCSKEGTLSDHPADFGGETYFGISRKFNPLWGGWAHIDAGEFEQAKQLVPIFYKEEYWDVMRLEALKSQKVANRMLEQSVNSNPRFVILNLQNIMNCLATDDGAIITEDGLIGNGTINRFNVLMPSYENAIEFALRCKYLNFLFDRAKSNPSQRVFMLGWINREMI